MDAAGAINISNLPGIGGSVHAQCLNDYAAANRAMTPEGVMEITGCSFREAMTLLLTLYNAYVGELWLLVRHSEHPQDVILYKKFLDGIPSIPFDCHQCHNRIEGTTDIVLDFMLTLDKEIEFSSRLVSIYERA